MSYSTDTSQMAVEGEAARTEMTGAIPDLVRIGQIPSNTAISIETDVLDAVVHTDKFCRFQLQNKGILHSHSKIVLRLDTSTADAFFPIGVGVHSLIDRCSLKVGTRTLSEIDDYNHYMGYKSMFMSNEHQKEREQLVSGRAVSHKSYYDDGQNASFTGQSDTSASFVGLDVGLYPSASGVVMETAGGVTLRPCQKTSSVIGGPEYQISLADLFPFLYTNQLPLYMMKEPVTIELHFSTGLERVIRTEGVAALAVTIDTTATQMIADYQYFPQEMMEEYAQQNAQMTFTYVDYRLAKRSLTSASGGSEVATGTQIMNLGGAGRIATKVMAMVSCEEVTNENVLGNYHAFGMKRDYSSASNVVYNGTLTSNIKYNDTFLYPIDLSNSARLFHETQKAEGMVPFVTREEYSHEGETTTPVFFGGYSQNSLSAGLVSKFFYQAYHLHKNERVNSRGIEYYFNYDKLPGSIIPSGDPGHGPNTFTLRCYIELMRVATLNDGMIDTFFA